jgi:hypothetical protein
VLAGRYRPPQRCPLFDCPAMGKRLSEVFVGLSANAQRIWHSGQGAVRRIFLTFPQGDNWARWTIQGTRAPTRRGEEPPKSLAILAIRVHGVWRGQGPPL